MKIIHPIRGQDDHGAGYYGASRGSRKHMGVDYACYTGSKVCATVSGKVTKLGKPYEDNPDTPNINELKAYDYVQITDIQGRDWRYFYVKPSVKVGQHVLSDSVIGTVQDLDKIYPDITNHYHLEIKKGSEYINPASVLGNNNQ